jgi:3-methylcrotonyl-CoA carboxylase alpha subunit
VPRFDSVLIANRGEIAVRIIRTCRAERLRTIAIYSDADAGALHVKRAHEAYRVGPPPPAESYLNRDAILEIARRTGAQAIHPGYGFLSENADFAEQCQQVGLVWIGPPPAAMRLLGDKAAAKAFAERLGVPILPGYHGADQDDRTLRAAAEGVGFPLLVKAAAGGGGRGMRLVEEPAQLDEALAAARRESFASFGDDRLLLERYVRRPRHVEMQIFGDEHGNVLWLGERDCSIQRRHQKVIEEAPAPNFSDEQRRAMGEAAVALAREAGYTNAGTVEFLLDEEGRFFFLEVNARLQVEHPVTEMVTGLDLVRLQLQIAAGDPLPLSQSDLRIAGHAIECRLYAEDPATGFLPSTGRIDRDLALPESEEPSDEEGSLRVDTGVEAGSWISPHYDPLIAKIIVREQDRARALRGMARALDGVMISGVRTNRDFLLAAVSHPSFRVGAVHTGFVEQHDLARRSASIPIEAVIAAAVSLALRAHGPAGLVGVFPGPRPSVWRQLGPWRPGWVGARVRLHHGEITHVVGISPPLDPNGAWRFEIDDRVVERRVERRDWGLQVETRDGWVEMRPSVVPGGVRVSGDGRMFEFDAISGLGSGAGSAYGEQAAQHDVIRAPMPGRIARLLVAPGDRVTANQTLLVLEAMKIEHLVTAPRDGVVESVLYNEGDQVELGAELIELED